MDKKGSNTVLYAVVLFLLLAGATSVMLMEHENSNAVDGEGSEVVMENIDSFPFSGITESNLSTIYAEYDNFSVDSFVYMNLLSDIVNGVFISGDYSYNF